MEYQQFYLDNYDLIERVINFTARRHRLSTTERDDFASLVHEKLIEKDYAVLRKFEHRSSFKTYLTTVVQRLYLDWRIALWGKWRPSAEARRLGPDAVLLEQLVTRDGLSAEEAIEMLRANHGVELPVAELRAILAALPHRLPRRFVSDDELTDVAAPDLGPEAALLRADEAQRLARLRVALEAALRALPEADVRLIEMRFTESFQISTIARTEGLDQKALYRRLERLLLELRGVLGAQGFSREDLRDVFGSHSEVPDDSDQPDKPDGPDEPDKS